MSDLLERSRCRLEIWEHTKNYETRMGLRRTDFRVKNAPLRYALGGWQVYQKEWEYFYGSPKIEFTPLKRTGDIQRLRPLFSFAEGVEKQRCSESAKRLMLAASVDGIIEYASIQVMGLGPSALSPETYGHFAPKQHSAFILFASNVSLDHQLGIYIRAFPSDASSSHAEPLVESIWPRSVCTREVLYQLEAKLITEVHDVLSVPASA